MSISDMPKPPTRLLGHGRERERDARDERERDARDERAKAQQQIKRKHRTDTKQKQRQSNERETDREREDRQQESESTDNSANSLSSRTCGGEAEGHYQGESPIQPYGARSSRYSFAHMCAIAYEWNVTRTQQNKQNKTKQKKKQHKTEQKQNRAYIVVDKTSRKCR